MFNLNTRVLVVDDMMTMRKLVKKICKEIGFTDIIEAGDGAQAWSALVESNPAVGLIISDWNMPNSSGLDLLKRVRADQQRKDIPFVMVTAEAERHQIVEALQAGVNNYVIKPFTSENLLQKLEASHQKLSATSAA